MQKSTANAHTTIKEADSYSSAGVLSSLIMYGDKTHLATIQSSNYQQQQI